MFGSLMKSRRFAPRFWCQFFSAFNDNFLKNALAFLVLYRIAVDNGRMLVTLGGAIFIAPSFVLSGLAGEIADRFDKALVARRLKFFEMAVALLAVFGFLVQSLPILFGTLLVFGAIS